MPAYCRILQRADIRREHANLRKCLGCDPLSVEGSGDPVPLIHGVGARQENWDGVAASLSRNFVVVRYDLRGHGNSSKVPGPYSLDMFANDATDLLDHLGIIRTHVAGQFSGWHDRAHAREQVSTACRSACRAQRRRGPHQEERRRVIERIGLIASGIPGDHFRNSLSRWFTDEFRAANPDVIEQYGSRNKVNDPACYAAAYTMLATSEVAPELPRIASPTLVITGERDLGSIPAWRSSYMRGLLARNCASCHGCATRSWSRRRTRLRICWSLSF